MNQNTLAGLNRRWWRIVIGFGLALGLGFVWLHIVWQPGYAARWLIIATVVAGFELWLLHRNLQHNYRQNESVLLPTLGAGNILTLFRGLLLAGLAGFLFSPWPPGALAWLPALLYTLAAITDGFDGYLARRANHATKLGQVLDIEFDALGIFIATTLAVTYKQLPWWYLSLGLARYLFVLGLWWRNRQGKPVYDLPFSVNRRLMAGFQMGFSVVMLWPIVYPPGTVLAGAAFALPLLIGFTRDWLIVSGRIDPAAPAYQALRHKLVIILTRWLPVGLRLTAITVALFLLLPAWPNPLYRLTQFVWLDVAHPHGLAAFILGLGWLATILLALGMAGRLAALGLLLVASANILSTGLQIDNGLMLVSTIYLMLWGSGNFSLWTPENRFLHRQA